MIITMLMYEKHGDEYDFGLDREYIKMKFEDETIQSKYSHCPFILSDNNLIYDFPCICVMNERWWNGGYITNKMTKSEKSEFVSIVNESKNIIMALASRFNEDIVLLGSFFNENNYEEWKNLKNKKLYKELRKTISESEYKEIAVKNSDELIFSVIEGNYNYLSRFSFYFPTKNILVHPTHNTEIHVFGNFSEEAVNTIRSSLPDKTWKADYL